MASSTSSSDVMSAAEKAAVRATVFSHLSGIVLAPTVKALADRGVFEWLGADHWITLDEVQRRTHGNRGYLRVALRLLASAGWAEQRLDDNNASASYRLTAEGRIAAQFGPPHYERVVSFIPQALYLEDFLFGNPDEAGLGALEELVALKQAGWGLAGQHHPLTAKVCNDISHHVDGLIIGPVMVALARAGILNELQYGPVSESSFTGNPANLHSVFELMACQGWLRRDRNLISLTPCGAYAAQIATSYGVTVSYLPAFYVVSTLLFGNARVPRMDENGIELLVNRAMNVWGSGGAHKTYFKKVDEIIIDIFSRPVDQQPQGICDMGCGDGTFLEHLYSVVKNQTPRGADLQKHPLILVGADFNKVARRIAKRHLRDAQIPTFQVIHGDINRPAQLASDLEALGLDIHDLLHVRSFLDHNRPYVPMANYTRGTRKARSTGAFSHLGEEISPDELEENLLRHLRRWAPYVGRFGLLVLELHTLPPEVTAANLEKTPTVAYDGTHGFSDQYLVELPIFTDCAREAGLTADPRHQAKFPPNELASVSINFFTADSGRT